jgi:hypothetical protein
MKITVSTEPPRRRTVLHNGELRRLHFPSTVYVLMEWWNSDPLVGGAYVNVGGAMFHTRGLPGSLDDELFHHLVSDFSGEDRPVGHSHVGRSGSLCLNPTASAELKRCRDVSQVFWNSGFRYIGGAGLTTPQRQAWREGGGIVDDSMLTPFKAVTGVEPPLTLRKLAVHYEKNHYVIQRPIVCPWKPKQIEARAWTGME